MEDKPRKAAVHPHRPTSRLQGPSRWFEEVQHVFPGAMNWLDVRRVSDRTVRTCLDRRNRQDQAASSPVMADGFSGA